MSSGFYGVSTRSVPSWMDLADYLKHARLPQPTQPISNIVERFSGVIHYCSLHNLCAGAVIRTLLRNGWTDQYKIISSDIRAWNGIGMTGITKQSLPDEAAFIYFTTRAWERGL